jgi:hypothetical protein
MHDEQTIKHPARDDSFIDALRRSEAGERIASDLEDMFESRPPHFTLATTPTNERMYIRELADALLCDVDLANMFLADEGLALCLDIAMGEFLATEGSGLDRVPGSNFQLSNIQLYETER